MKIVRLCWKVKFMILMPSCLINIRGSFGMLLAVSLLVLLFDPEDEGDMFLGNLVNIC
jgi:hypothetical protein